MKVITTVRKYIMIAATFVAFGAAQPNEAQAQTSPLSCGIQNMWYQENGRRTDYERVVCTAMENNTRLTAATANRGNCNLRAYNNLGNPNLFYFYFNSTFEEKTLQFGDRIAFNIFCRNPGVPSILQYSVTANGTTWNWNVTPR
jgi:hypothetical protein